MLDPTQHRAELIVRRDQGVLDLNGHTDAQKFHGGIGSLDLLRALRASRQRQRPLSLNVQLPSRLKSCAPVAGTGLCVGDGAERYLQALEREISLVANLLGPGQRIEQFHLGGGTPGAAHLPRLMKVLRSRFNFLEHGSGDYSVEVDLHHTDWATMGLLRDHGFNHVSIGVPDIGADSEWSVDCYQNPVPVHSLIDAARTFGFRSISVDLGYGRAWQTPESFALKLASIIALEPDRLQVFDYAQLPHRYRLSADDPSRALCSEEDKGAMRQTCFEQLLAAGYDYIGLGHFVRPDDDLAIAQERGGLRRTCQGFTRHGYCDHIGLGMGAISQIDALCAQNLDDIERYQQQLQSGQLATCRGWRGEGSDRLRERIMERLSCDMELDVLAVEARHGMIFRKYFASAWQRLTLMSGQGWVELSDRFICILPAGRRHVDTICDVFALDERSH